jgi:hypothetical protein
MSDHDEGYTGPAVLAAGGRELAVQVRLDARHEPHDGRLHWFGRLTPDGDADALAALAGSADLHLATGGGRAPVRLGEQDPWGRYRVTGVGRPPFALDDPVLDED